MAAPVLDADGRAWAGVAIQGPTARLADARLAELAPVLVATAGADGRGRRIGCRSMTRWHLAELNIARLRQPLDHPDTAEFVAALDEINALAESSPGFVWRLTDDSGQSSSYVRGLRRPADDHQPLGVGVARALARLRVPHRPHRRSCAAAASGSSGWTRRTSCAGGCPPGHVPSVDEAVERLDRLRTRGRQRRRLHAARLARPPAVARPPVASAGAWNASASSASPTPARARSTTP